MIIQRFLLTKHTSGTNSEGKIFFCIFLMIINFRSINDEKIWETWDPKNYVNNIIFSPNSSYFLRIQQNWGRDNFQIIEKNKKSFEILRKKLKNKSFGEFSDIFIFCFTVCQGVIKKSEKIWKVMRKTLRIKKRIGEKFRKTVENECFEKIYHFLIDVLKPTENLKKV